MMMTSAPVVTLESRLMLLSGTQPSINDVQSVSCAGELVTGGKRGPAGRIDHQLTITYRPLMHSESQSSLSK